MAWELASIGDIKVIDTEKIKAVLKLAQEQQEAIARVRELHFDTQFGFCGHCWSWNGEYDTLYPCDTIKALDGEQ